MPDQGSRSLEIKKISKDLRKVLKGKDNDN